LGTGCRSSGIFTIVGVRHWYLHNSDARNSLSPGRVEPQRGEGSCGKISLKLGRLLHDAPPRELASSFATLPRESEKVV
jgi:hypothetical protein